MTFTREIVAKTVAAAAVMPRFPTTTTSFALSNRGLKEPVNQL